MATQMAVTLPTFPTSILAYLSSLNHLNRLLILALSLKGNVKARHFKENFKHIIYQNHICFLCWTLYNQYMTWRGFIKRMELFSILQHRKSSKLHFIMLPSTLTFFAKSKVCLPMSLTLYNLKFTYPLLWFPGYFKYIYLFFQSG